jgi:D-lactate dehydrogenase (cytochrome)
MKPLIYQMNEMYEEYLSDESKLIGNASSISFPKTELEIAEIIKMMLEKGKSITVQGGNTGICGGAVAESGHILNLTKMNEMKSLSEYDGKYLLTVQPGCSLFDLKANVTYGNFKTRNWDENSKRALEKLKNMEPFMWAPDPTELSATIGGVVSTNASGICSRLYGGTREHVNSIRVITKDAELWEIERGKYVFENGEVILPNGQKLKVDPIQIGLDEKADLIDIFIGSEGMFGVITSITLELIPQPEYIWGICFFFESEGDAIHFAEIANTGTEDVIDCFAGLEFLDKASLLSIQAFKKISSQQRELPDISDVHAAMVYIEIHANSNGQATIAAEWLMERAEETRSNIDASWAFMGASEREKVHKLRHSVSEYLNIRIGQLKKDAPTITKLATDMEFPSIDLSSLLSKFRHDLESCGLDAVIFGHILNGHLHVNFLPKNSMEYEQGKLLILKWSKIAQDMGGKIAVEHGIGKLKKSLFLSTASQGTLEAWKALKMQLDPDGIWNPGNMLDIR